MSKKIYISYGSNMNREQMKYRAANAKVYGKGYLLGYELNFTGNKNGNNYATVIKKEGAKTPIVLWSTYKIDEMRLDIYEGYPNFYRKEFISAAEIEITKKYSNDKLDNAYIYIMNSDILGVPTNQYFGGILDAYESFGIDTEPLYDALKRCKL